MTNIFEPKSDKNLSHIHHISHQALKTAYLDNSNKFLEHACRHFLYLCMSQIASDIYYGAWQA